MFKRIQLLLIAGMLLCAGNMFGQRIGLLPPKTKWQQIHDDSLRIIYPQGEDEKAKRVAALMLKLASADPITTQGRYRPISVLLQPQTNISNGYVGLAPYVSEFYLTPHENPFTLGSLPWHELLALHEYRHVMQINAANTGVSHVIKTLLGDLAFSGLYSLAINNWFREGDAVFSETRWSLQGRGRLSGFILPFHEKLVQGVTWNYYKLRNGSYREYIPDNYVLGYLLVQFGNHVFGEATWDTIIQTAATYKHLVSPFSGTMREIYGKKNKFFYLDAMEWYAAKWEAYKDMDIIYPLISIEESDMKNDFYNMEYPSVAEDGSIYSTVTTFDHTTAIYKFKTDGTNRKVISMGLQQDPYFDYKNHRFVWTELRFDPRWVRRDKNVIVVFDEETGKKRSIEPRKGFYTPSLDKKGERIAALHEDRDGNYQIQILDARNGSLLASLPNADNLYLAYPIWSEDELSIIATARDDQGRMALVEEDIATGNIKNITHYSFTVLGRPILHDQWIFLATNLDTLDQVYAVDRHEGIFYRMSRGSTSHYDPAWDELHQAIVCSEYRLNGKKLVRLPGTPSKEWKLTALDNGVKEIDVEGENLLAPGKVVRDFEVEKYSPWSGIINFHSLTVAIDDPVVGFAIRSDNIMNNLSIIGGYEYNANSQAQGPYANVRFGAMYPVFSFGVSQVSRKEISSDDQHYKIKNGQINFGISLPLVFTPGVFTENLLLSSTYHIGNSMENPTIEDGVDYNYRFNYITNRVVLINSRNKAYRQVMPTWAQRLDFSYTHELSGVYVSQLYTSGEFAFPAITRVHYLTAQAEFLMQDIREGALLLGSPYAGARGFPSTDGERQYHFGVTYGIPIWYPDIGIGNILFVRRVRLQPFFDVAHTDAVEAHSELMQSAGLELVTEVKFPPVTFGFRFTKLLSGYTGNSNVFQFFIPVVKF